MSYTALSLTQSTERGSKGIEMNCFAFADAGGVEAGEALITSSDATNETALTGTMGIAVTGVVTGSGTAFDTELSLGDVIKVGSTYHKVISETSATVIGVAPIATLISTGTAGSSVAGALKTVERIDSYKGHVYFTVSLRSAVTPENTQVVPVDAG